MIKRDVNNQALDEYLKLEKTKWDIISKASNSKMSKELKENDNLLRLFIDYE